MERYKKNAKKVSLFCSLTSQLLFLPALIVGGVVIETMRGRGKQERELGYHQEPIKVDEKKL